MHGPRGTRKLVKKMMTELREAFPDLNFCGVGELIAEGDYVAAAGMAAAPIPARRSTICASVSCLLHAVRNIGLDNGFA